MNNFRKTAVVKPFFRSPRNDAPTNHRKVCALGNLENPENIDGGPHRIIQRLEAARKWFVLASVVVALLGVWLDQLTSLLDIVIGAAGTMTPPLTAISIISLAVAILSSDRRYAGVWLAPLAAMLAILLCVMPIALNLAGFAPIRTGILSDTVGQDEALVIVLLAVSVLVRFQLPMLGLMTGFAATALAMHAVISNSYGLPDSNGQMMPLTLIALTCAIWAVISLYLHRPIVRVMFLSGSIGMRTRVMMAVGFLAPWACGMVLYHWYRVPERAFPVEATLISAIIWIMLAVTLASGFLHEVADKKRRLAEHRLAQQAIQDPLTGLLNRGGLNKALSAQWNRFQRSGVSAAVFVIDLDHFKLINDTYGHSVGDVVLRSVRRALLPYLREEDVIGRWGGEEFLCVLNETDLRHLHQIAERLRAALQAISDLPAMSHGKGRISVSGSIGVSTYLQGDRGFEEAIRRADDALYVAKRNGRNRVVFDPLLRRKFIRPARPESVLTA